MGGLFLFPGILFGGLFGLYAILAVLNVAGIVIGSIFSGIGAAISAVVGGIGEAFSGIASGVGSVGSIAIGVVIGFALYFYLKKRNARSAEEV